MDIFSVNGIHGHDKMQNHYFRFRVSKKEFEIIKTEARIKGYKTVAPYIRDLALKIDYSIKPRIIKKKKKVKTNPGSDKMSEETPEWVEVLKNLVKKSKERGEIY